MRAQIYTCNVGRTAMLSMPTESVFFFVSNFKSNVSQMTLKDSIASKATNGSRRKIKSRKKILTKMNEEGKQAKESRKLIKGH